MTQSRQLVQIITSSAASSVLAVAVDSRDDTAATTDIVFTAANIKADGDGNATGNGLKLSAIAQAYIKSAGDALSVTVAEVADSDETVGLAAVTGQTITTTIGNTDSLVSGTVDYTITLSGGTGTHVETLQLDVTVAEADASVGATATETTTAGSQSATTTLTGAKADTGGGDFHL